jgi:glycosyltransferase involved in cell wall biosynthesis
VKVAIVHPYPVHTGGVGGVTRVLALARHLARRHEVHVLAHSHGRRDEEEAAIAEMAALGVRQRVFPRPASPPWKKARWALSHAPYFVGHNRSPALEAALAALDTERGLDVVHVEMAYLEPLLRGVGARCVRVLAEQELMSLALERLRAVPLRHKSAYQCYIGLELGAVRRFEAEALPRFHRLYGITPGEAARMAALAGREVGVLPHVVDTRAFTPPASPPERGPVLFVGSYTHHPNVEAAFWLMERVWPAVARAVPGARVRLVGPGLDGKRHAALQALGAELPGRVDDLAAEYRHALVFVNPIHSGAGMRGKLLEACASALPVVSTSLGMEGLAAVPGVECERADDPAAFAAALIALLRDPARRAEHGRAGRALVAARYDAEVVLDGLERDYATALSALRGTGPSLDARALRAHPEAVA